MRPIYKYWLTHTPTQCPEALFRYIYESKIKIQQIWYYKLNFKLNTLFQISIFFLYYKLNFKRILKFVITDSKIRYNVIRYHKLKKKLCIGLKWAFVDPWCEIINITNNQKNNKMINERAFEKKMDFQCRSTLLEHPSKLRPPYISFYLVRCTL